MTLPSSPYRPENHYWQIGADASQLWSSAAVQYIDPLVDATYLAWAAAGNLASRIASEQELWDVLAAQAESLLPSEQMALLTRSRRSLVRRLEEAERDAASYDATTPPTLKDDFLAGSTETGEVGELGWSFTNGSAAPVAAQADHPGIVRRTSGAVANQVASMYLGAAVTTQLFQIGAVREFCAIVSAPAAGSDWAFRIGFMPDVSAAQPASGVYIEKAAAGGFRGVVRNAGAETSTAEMPVTPGAWYKFRIRWFQNTLRFSINGGAEFVVSANLPPAALGVNLGMQIVPTTTTARTINLDFVGLKLEAGAR